MTFYDKFGFRVDFMTFLGFYDAWDPCTYNLTASPKLALNMTVLFILLKNHSNMVVNKFTIVMAIMSHLNVLPIDLTILPSSSAI